jgi:hypothetical protein
MASILERLKRIGAGGSDVAETRQTPAPIEERSIKKAMVSPGEKTYKFTYDVGRKNYIDPGAGFLFNMPPVPTRSASTPTRPTAVDPTQQTDARGNMTQDIIPVMPNLPLSPSLDVQETLTVPQRVSSDLRPRQLPPPVRQPEGSFVPPMPMPETPTLDTTIADLMGRYKGLYGEDMTVPTRPDFTPTQTSMAPPMPSGLFEGVPFQLTQPNVPQVAMQPLEVDLGALAEQTAPSFEDMTDEEIDNYFDALINNR